MRKRYYWASMRFNPRRDLCVRPRRGPPAPDDDGRRFLFRRDADGHADGRLRDNLGRAVLRRPLQRGLGPGDARGVFGCVCAGHGGRRGQRGPRVREAAAARGRRRGQGAPVVAGPRHRVVTVHGARAPRLPADVVRDDVPVRVLVRRLCGSGRGPPRV